MCDCVDSSPPDGFLSSSETSRARPISDQWAEDASESCVHGGFARGWRGWGIEEAFLELVTTGSEAQVEGRSTAEKAAYMALKKCWPCRTVGITNKHRYVRCKRCTSARRIPTESFRPYNSMLEALEAPVSFSISWSDSVMSGWNGILCVILCTYEKYKDLHRRTRLAGKFLVNWTLSRQHSPFAPFLLCKRTGSVHVWSISISKE